MFSFQNNWYEQSDVENLLEAIEPMTQYLVDVNEAGKP